MITARQNVTSPAKPNMSEASETGSVVSEEQDHRADTMYAVFVTADMPVEVDSAPSQAAGKTSSYQSYR